MILANVIEESKVPIYQSLVAEANNTTTMLSTSLGPIQSFVKVE